MKFLFIILIFVGTLYNCNNLKLPEEKTVKYEDSIYENKIIDSIVGSYSSINNIELSYMKYELVDLNYDGKEDLIIYFNGVGTGVLRLVKVFIYNSELNNYIYDKNLSSLNNPSYYMDRKLITAFYIGHGGGDGLKLEWNGKVWDTSEVIKFEPDSKFEQKWIMSIYNKSGKLVKKTNVENFLIPDTAILPHQW